VITFGDDVATRCVFLSLSSYVDVPRATRTEVFGWTHRPDEMAVVPWAGHPAQLIGSTEEVECVEIVDLVVQDAADWVVSGLLVDGASRHARPDLVEEFAAHLRQSAEAHGPIRVPRRGQVGLAGVVYAGRRASAKFYGCALGRVVETRGSARSFAAGDGDRVTLPVDSEGWRGRRGAGVSLTYHVTGAPVLVRSLVIQDPHDWVVNGLRIDGRSQLLYPGDLPSEALRAPGRLGMHLDVAHGEVEILVSYAGEQEFGPELRCTIVGCPLNN
jgi:hypothetical protein